MPSRRDHPGVVLVVVLVYAALFFTFDTLAVLFEVAPGVSLWYPSAGLNLALLAGLGLRYAPLVFLATLGSGLLIATPPLPLTHLVLPGLIVTLGNAGAAWWLRRTLPSLTLTTTRSVGHFAAAAVVLPAFISTLSVTSYTLMGLTGYTWNAFGTTVFQWWIGDVVGILTLTPLLLVVARPLLQPAGGNPMHAWQHSGLIPSLHRRSILSFLMELGAIALMLYVTLWWWPTGSHPLYLCFLPLLWLALRHGLPCAILGVFLTNTGMLIILAAQGINGTAAIGEAQLYVIVLALTGLFPGALVSERQQALHLLRDACRNLETRVQHHSRALGEAMHGAASPPQEDSLQHYAHRLLVSGDRIAEHMTRQAERNEELSTTEQELRATQDRKDRFFSLISHDLKNLLMGTSGFTEMLSEEADTLPRALIREFAVRSHFSVSNAQTLLENLLQWARMESGTLHLNTQRTDLREVVQETLERLAPEADCKEIRLNNRLTAPTFALADEHLIGSVIQNLVSNAIKFTEPGGQVTLHARRRAEEVEVHVEDTGIGIPPDRLQQVFEPNARGSTLGTEGETGTGIGLFLCKQIIEEHSGSIHVESVPDRGSVFRFTLPVPSSLPSESRSRSPFNRANRASR